MICVWRTGMDLEGNGHGLRYYSWHFPGGTEKNKKKNLNQDSQCPGWESPEYKSRALPLDKPD
jgi:hypothetical protein